MGARAAISVDEYLRTSFADLDREFRDGELVERSLPDYLHGRTQIRIGAFFEALRQRLHVLACSELRLKLRDGLILIPDVCVYWPSAPRFDLVVDVPPLITVEILSKDDRLSAVRDKLEEYRTWGVKHVWLVDPHSRRMYTCEGGLTEAASLRVPELEIELLPEDVFDAAEKLR